MDVTQYIGIPYVLSGRDHSGVDCYGLIYLVYREQLRIELPRYEGLPDPNERLHQTLDLLDIARSSGLWDEVPRNQLKAGDVIELKILGASHIGIYVPEGQMLHCLEGSGTCLESISRTKFKHRIRGCFRLRY